MGQRRGGIDSEMPPPAFLTEQASFQHQLAGHQSVAQIEQQVEVAPTAVVQQQIVHLQAVQQRLLVQVDQVAAQLKKTQNEMERCFLMFDKNHDFSLQRAELIQFMHSRVPSCLAVDDQQLSDLLEEMDFFGIYDVNKDGRLNTNERAAVSKDVEAGKFKTMDWLMKYVTRPPGRSSSRYRDMREEPREKARLDLYRKHDVNKDGRLDDAERANVRAALKKYYAEREANRKSAAEEK